MNNLLGWQYCAEQKLQEKGLASNDVNLIFEKVYGADFKNKLLAQNLEYDPELDKILFEVLEMKRPIAHIVGFEYFYGRKYVVTKDVLIPRIETENLIYESIKQIKKQFSNRDTIRVLDLCTGSGIVGITAYKELQEVFNVDLTMSDISSKALEVAKINIKNLNVKADIIESDLFENIEGKFDVILSNPPYVPYDQEMGNMVQENEPHLALYADNDGIAIYELIREQIFNYTNEQYFIGFEIGDGQGKVLNELYNQKYANINVVCDLFGRERNVLIWE